MNTVFRLGITMMLGISSLVAQEKVAPPDSLLRLLETLPEKDTNRVWTYLRLTNAYFTTNPDSAMIFADRALQTSEDIGWSKGRTMAYKVKGGVYYVQSDFVRALDYWQKSIDADSGKSTFHEAAIRNNMAVVYREFKDYPKARQNFLYFAKIAEQLKQKEQLSMAYANLASVYALEKKYDSAEHYAGPALQLAKDTGNIRIQASILTIWGSICKETGKYKEGLAMLEEAVRLADQESVWFTKAPALNNMAFIYREMGNLAQAEKSGKASLQLAEQINNLTWQYEAWEELARIHEAQGRPADALKAYTRFVALKDSAMNTEKKNDITRMEMRVEAAAREAKLNAEHEAEVKAQQMRTYATGAGGGLLLVGGLAGFGLYRKRKESKQKQQEAELKAEVIDIEMKALRAQMNPHFIFNSLNSISDFITRNDPDNARQYLGKFAQLMRLTLEHSEKKEIPLSDELHALELYMKLESLRLNHKFSWNISVDPAIDPENTMLPPLILQPYVENSIWHGISKKEGPGHIRINIQRFSSEIICTISDDGIGRQASAAIQGNGSKPQSMGTSITASRIGLLNRLGQADAQVHYKDLSPGLQVDIRLPYLTNFDA